MGIKSTIDLSRSAAESDYVTVKAEIYEIKQARKVKYLNDEELGNRLDRLTDKLADMKGITNFYNYQVVN